MDTTRFLFIASLMLGISSTATLADQPVQVVTGNDHVQSEHRIDRGHAIRRVHVINHNHQQDAVKVYVVHTPVYIELNRDLQHQGHGEIDRNMSLVAAQRLARYLNANKVHVVRNENAEASEMPVQAPVQMEIVQRKRNQGQIDTVKAEPKGDDTIDTRPVDRELTHDEVALAK